MTDDQMSALAERLVMSFEKIAVALEGLDVTYRRHYEKLYPERKEIRDAVVSRVPTEEDRIREAHGASDKPVTEWLNDIEREEEDAQDVGVRERQWLEAQGRAGQERG